MRTGSKLANKDGYLWSAKLSVSRARVVQRHANIKSCLATDPSQDFYTNLHVMAVLSTLTSLDELQQLI